MAFDLVVRNGTVVDGSGSPRFRADVGVAGQPLCFGARAQEVHEILNFCDTSGGQSLELVEQGLFARAVQDESPPIRPPLPRGFEGEHPRLFQDCVAPGRVSAGFNWTV